jgi:O-methyltransferase
MDIYPTYSTHDVFEHTYNITKDVKLSGSIVECGVAAGSNFAQMIKASIDSGINRNYYGFDSFNGIPFGLEVDVEQPGIGKLDPAKYGLLESSGITVHDKKGVIENLTKWNVMNDNIHLIEGWFQDTLSKTETGDIAVLRLDGDLYESTKVCLEVLYSRVQKGGLILIDDYELAGCQKAVNDFIKHRQIKLERYSYTAYWYK